MPSRHQFLNFSLCLTSFQYDWKQKINNPQVILEQSSDYNNYDYLRVRRTKRN